MRRHDKTKWADRVRTALRRPGPNSPRSVVTSPPFRCAPASATWDEAFERVESYLRAHHIESRIILNELTTDILKTARRVAATDPANEEPVTLAMQIAHARLGEWMAQAMPEGEWTDPRFRARGRLAVLLAGVPTQIPEQFLAATPLPEAWRDRLAQGRLQPSPELRRSNMGHTPLEFALADAVEQQWTTFHRSSFFRASFSWACLAGLAGLSWLMTR